MMPVVKYQVNLSLLAVYYEVKSKAKIQSGVKHINHCQYKHFQQLTQRDTLSGINVLKIGMVEMKERRSMLASCILL